jgi:excisionase family DNA binding protein
MTRPSRASVPHDASYWTASEVAAYLHLPSRTAVYRLVREHDLPYRSVGRQLRFVKAEIDVWSQRPALRVPLRMAKAGAR